jgi:hypothetical protein
LCQRHRGVKVPVAAGRAANLEGERPLPSIARFQRADVKSSVIFRTCALRLGANSAVALLFKRPDELIASPGCPEGRAEVSFFQKAGDVYCGVGYYK